MPQPMGRDLDKTRDRLTRWLNEKIIGASGLEVAALQGPKDTGFSSDTLMFSLSYEKDGEREESEKVIRLAPAGDFSVFPEYDVGLQYEIMRALETSQVPVPKMFWLEKDPTLLGQPFYIMEKLDGVVPSDNPPYHSEGWIVELKPGERERLWYSGLEAMAEVHKLDIERPEFDLLSRPGPAETTVGLQLQYWERYIAWGMEPSRYDLIRQGLDWLKENRPSERKVGLCWGDARISNQIFSECRSIAVIDWEMAFVGSPVADLAWFITMDRVLSEGLGLERLSGLPNRGDSIVYWESCAGLEAEDYEYYEIFAAWRFAVIMARVFLQMKHYDILPDEVSMDVENLTTPVLSQLLRDAH